MEHPTPAAVKRGTELLVGRCFRLLRHLTLKTPDCVVADAVLLVWDAAVLALGPALHRQLAAREVTRLRTQAGLCTLCDAAPAAGDWLCERHKAKTDVELSFSKDAAE